MANFEKNFIGKGKKIAGMDIVRVTIALTALTEIAYDYTGEKYCTFEVAGMKEADQFGRTHSVYHNKKTGEAAPKKTTAKKRNRKLKVA